MVPAEQQRQKLTWPKAGHLRGPRQLIRNTRVIYTQQFFTPLTQQVNQADSYRPVLSLRKALPITTIGNPSALNTNQTLGPEVQGPPRWPLGDSQLLGDKEPSRDNHHTLGTWRHSETTEGGTEEARGRRVLRVTTKQEARGEVPWE